MDGREQNREDEAMFMAGAIAFGRKHKLEYYGILLIALEEKPTVREKMIAEGSKTELSREEEDAIVARYGEIYDIVLPRVDKIFEKCIGYIGVKGNFRVLMCSGTERTRRVLSADADEFEKIYKQCEDLPKSACVAPLEKAIGFESGDLQMVIKYAEDGIY